MPPEPGMCLYTGNPSTREAEAGRLLNSEQDPVFKATSYSLVLILVRLFKKSTQIGTRGVKFPSSSRARDSRRGAALLPSHPQSLPSGMKDSKGCSRKRHHILAPPILPSSEGGGGDPDSDGRGCNCQDRQIPTFCGLAALPLPWHPHSSLGLDCSSLSL